MITKEKIIAILQSHSFNVEDQAGNHLIVVDDDSWDAVATEVVGRSEQFYCTCSRAKGLDHDEECMPYCIDCQKPVQ